MKRTLYLFLYLLFLINSLKGQVFSDSLNILDIPKKPNKQRFWLLTGTYLTAYSGTTLWLDRIWYAQYPRGKFHFFNDFGGWHNVDKAGHLFTAYMQAKWGFDAYRWTGLPRRQAMWYGVGLSVLSQTTLEVLDGFSTEYGASWGDLIFNTAGTGIFAAQELAWQEQRISVKLSSSQPHYSNELIHSNIPQHSPTTYRTRAVELYGKGYPEALIKDYNAMTIWASANIASFLPEEKRGKFPRWLNIAVGYSANNLYGAERNSWGGLQGKEDDEYFADPTLYPRYSEWFLSFDVDFTKIRTNKRGLKFLFGVLNMFKMPSPTLEWNTQKKWRFRPLMW
jgi:hypothetical protein